MKPNYSILILFVIVFSKIAAQDNINSNQLDSSLVAILDSIHHSDQKYREKLIKYPDLYKPGSKEFNDLWDSIVKIDSLNLIIVTDIIDTKGWLGKSVIGEKGNKTLWLVIQHSNIETQEKYLPIMKQAVLLGNAEAKDMALLEDRLLLAKGEKQIYGSQLMRDNATGELFVQPIYDPDNVDKRRLEIGLDSMSVNLRRWNMSWDPVEHKKRFSTSND
jgi:hypothetical protein